MTTINVDFPVPAEDVLPIVYKALISQLPDKLKTDEQNYLNEKLLTGHISYKDGRFYTTIFIHVKKVTNNSSVLNIIAGTNAYTMNDGGYELNHISLAIQTAALALGIN